MKRGLGLITILVALLLIALGTTGCGGSSTAAVAAPAITTQPVSVSVATGSAAAFTVTATGTGTLTYQWYKSGTAISGATSATYAITAAAAADAGSYTVTVTNAGGSTGSAAATLTVEAAVADGWNLVTGANPGDDVAGTTFAYTVAIALDGVAVTTSDPSLVVGAESGGAIPVTLAGATVITVTKTAYGLTVNSALPDGVHAAFALSGTYAGGVTFFSTASFKLALDGVAITSADGPALNIQSSVRAFVVLKAGSANTLADAATYSTRYLADGVTAMDLKAAFFSEGPLLFSGEGSLTAVSAKKHALCSDAHVRLASGTLALTSQKKDGIRANDAFIMDGGTLAIQTASGAGKGIKVEGREDATTPLGFIAVNGGTLGITSYDKAITASWETAEDATTTDTADDPDPFVTINGGTITISTFGTPFEDTNLTDGDTSLSPEGIESKSTLTINGGTLAITTTDDALNAGKSLVINGGTIYAKASANDAIDSNGTLTITGGVIVADGSGGAEGGLDCDQNTFKVTGGTFMGVGGRNSTPTASVCTQNTVSLGAGTAGTLVVVRDGTGAIAIAFQVPYTCAAMLVSSSLFKTGTAYTVYTGGSLTSFTSLFNGLYLGAAGHSGGTAGRTFTISSAYTGL